jgi:3-methyladenine DNA glycosylase AlkD
MTNSEIKLGNLIDQHLYRIGNEGFGKSRSKFINTDQETYGVPLPAIKKLVRKYLNEYTLDGKSSSLEKEAMYLLEQPIFDSKIAGIQILAVMSEEKLLADTKVIKKIIQYTTDWALVDTLATDVVTVILKNNPNEVDSLIGWAKSDNSWLRRCSIVSLIKTKDHIRNWGEYKKLLLNNLTHENDPYVKKAIKWLKSTLLFSKK